MSIAGLSFHVPYGSEQVTIESVEGNGPGLKGIQFINRHDAEMMGHRLLQLARDLEADHRVRQMSEPRVQYPLNPHQPATFVDPAP